MKISNLSRMRQVRTDLPSCACLTGALPATASYA